MEDRGGNVVGNVRQRVVCSGTTKKACVTRSRANKREATDESTSTGGPIASCASSTPERGGAPVTKMKPLPLSNSVLTKRRSTTKVSGAVDRQSWQRFLETMNAVSLFSVVRQLQLQHRKYPVSSQRTRTLTPHQGSMFCKPSTVLFPPGALPENLVVWIYCIKDMPAQPKSVASCHPWHLGKILYCKPAPGFTLGYLHHSGVPESVNTYLMEWTVNGPPSTSIGSQSSTQFQSCHNASPVTNPSLSCVSSRRSTQSSYSLLDHVDKSLPRAAESREREDDVSNDPPLTSCHISQQHDNASSHASRLTLDPSLRLDLVTGASSMSCICPSDEAVAACAPWQFLYYVHYQGYNRRYDRWVSLDELRPSIIDPHTNRVCASALARHYISALHSLGHPKWKSYTADSKNTPTTPFPSPDVKGTISGDAKENFSSEASHAQAALLALRLLSSLLYHWAVGYESNRGRRDMTHLIDWCCNFWKSPGDEGPLMFTRERRALLWVSQLLFSYFQLDAIDLYTSALRASKKKKKSSCSNVSSLTPTTPVLESDVVWGPLRSMWTAAVELLEHRRGIACSLLNDKTRPLNSIWETVMLPSRSRDTCKVPMSSLLMSIIEAVVHRIMNHRGSLYEQPLVFFRNYSCVDTFDDIHSDDGEHEGIDPASIEAHEAMTKLRTIDTLQIDNYVVATWYYSPFPLRFHPAERVYICGGCLCYFFYEAELKRHEQLCTQLRPPGHEIYRDGRLSFFQVDGEAQSGYCENLSLMSKLFLDHKTLQYSVTPFLFYILIEWDEACTSEYTETLRHAGMVPARGSQFVGYFSKEKVSSLGYNLACILTLPQHQRKGYGKYFMHFSYSLSKLEGKTGTPERPLSDLGRLSYTKYWKQVILALFQSPVSSPPACFCTFSRLVDRIEGCSKQSLGTAFHCSLIKELLDSVETSSMALERKPQFIYELSLSIDDIAHFTALRREDIIYVLQLMKILRKSSSSDEYVIYFDSVELQKGFSLHGCSPPEMEPSHFLLVPWSASTTQSCSEPFSNA